MSVPVTIRREVLIKSLCLPVIAVLVILDVIPRHPVFTLLLPRRRLNQPILLFMTNLRQALIRSRPLSTINTFAANLTSTLPTLTNDNPLLRTNTLITILPITKSRPLANLTIFLTYSAGLMTP